MKDTDVLQPGSIFFPRHPPPKTVLDRNESSSQPRHRGSGRSDTSTRLFRLV